MVDVLGVVEPGQAASVADLSHFQLTSSGTIAPIALDSCSAQVRVSRKVEPGGDRYPDLDAAPPGDLQPPPARRGAPAPCGAAGPGRARRPRKWPRRGRCRSGRRSGWPGRWRGGPGVPFQRAEVGRPHQRRRLVRPPDRSWSRRAWRPGCASAGSTAARGRAAACARSRASAAPPGKRCMFSGRPARYGRTTGRDPGGVGDQLALGHRRLAVPAGEQLLVEVRQPQLPAERFPPAAWLPRPSRAASSASVGPAMRGGRSATDACRGRQVRAPDPVRVGPHLLVGPPAEHRLRVVLRVPAADRVRHRALCSSSHWSRRSRRFPPLRTSTNATAQLAGRATSAWKSRQPPPPPRGRRCRAAPTCRCPTRSRRRRRTGRAGSRPRSRGTRSGGPRRGRPGA